MFITTDTHPANKLRQERNVLYHPQFHAAHKWAEDHFCDLRSINISSLTGRGTNLERGGRA
jgi:hypothetical protein